MKKIIICGSLFLSSLFLTVSCQKTKMNPESALENSASYDFRKDNSFIETFGNNEEHVNVSSSQRLNITELIEIAKIEDEEVRKTAISMLTLPEKLDFWNYVITYQISNGKFNETQKQLLTDLKVAVVKPQVFANKNLQEVLGANYLPLIASQLISRGISQDNIYKIFCKGSVLNKTIPGGGDVPDCNCNADSNWSCSSCKRTDNCWDSSFGCGFVGWFSCNGLCGKLAGYID